MGIVLPLEDEKMSIWTTIKRKIIPVRLGCIKLTGGLGAGVIIQDVRSTTETFIFCSQVYEDTGEKNQLGQRIFR